MSSDSIWGVYSCIITMWSVDLFWDMCFGKRKFHPGRVPWLWIIVSFDLLITVCLRRLEF